MFVMDELFCKFGEAADKLTSSAWFLVIFNAALAVIWVMFGTDQANIFISIITAESVLITAGASRRAQMALHAKLDELVHTSAEAREELVHAEEKSEKEIQELKV